MSIKKKDEIKVGDTWKVNFEEMWFPAKVLQIKKPGYGRTLLLITPVGGRGERWIEATVAKKSIDSKK